jgi:hypothetical protein
MGPRLYEHNGFRVSGLDVRFERPGPTLGQDDEWVQTQLLGLSAKTRATLTAEDLFK